MAKVHVDLVNLGSAYTLTLTLQPTPDGWRIADIASKNTPSLLAYLKTSNAHPGQGAPQPGPGPTAPKR